jgi:hypothetical protein
MLKSRNKAGWGRPRDRDAHRRETALADRHGYTPEWKVYGHHGPPNLVDSLLAAEFEPDDKEQCWRMSRKSPVTPAAGTSTRRPYASRPSSGNRTNHSRVERTLPALDLSQKAVRTRPTW